MPSSAINADHATHHHRHLRFAFGSRRLALFAGIVAMVALGLAWDVALAESTASVSVVYNPPSCEGSVVAWDPAAKAAFDFAAAKWGALLSSSQPIVIEACWRNDMDESDLGAASAFDFFSDFEGAPFAGTLYPVALANTLSASDQNGPDPEISADFNSAVNWYFGTDGDVPKDKIEFASLVLHEIGHGLGLGGGMIVEGGLGKRLNSSPEAYDHFTKDAVGHGLLDESIYPNNSAILAAALQSDAIFFDGPHTRAAFGGRPVPIYAPSDFLPGSSYSHVGEIFNGTVDGVMTFQQDNGESALHPGWVALGILQDMGWPLQDDAGPAPALLARPGYAGFEVEAGADNPSPITINLFINRPDVKWTATVTSDSDWLHAGSTTGQGSGPLTLTAATAGMAAGYFWGQVRVTLDDNPSISQIIRAPLVVSGDGAPSENLVKQGDMEGDGSQWQQDSNVADGLIFADEEGGKNVARSGTQIAGLGFFDGENSTLQQTVAIPAIGRVSLVYYTRVESFEKCGLDSGTVLIDDEIIASLALCQENAGAQWQANVVDLAAYHGQTVALKFQANTDDSEPSAWLLDDVAIFTDASPATLIVTKSGEGSVSSTPSGIDCGADCTELFSFGTVVTLTAQAADGFHFAGWSGACNGIKKCVTTMSVAKSVVATFAVDAAQGTLHLPALYNNP